MTYRWVLDAHRRFCERLAQCAWQLAWQRQHVHERLVHSSIHCNKGKKMDAKFGSLSKRCVWRERKRQQTKKKCPRIYSKPNVSQFVKWVRNISCSHEKLKTYQMELVQKQITLALHVAAIDDACKLHSNWSNVQLNQQTQMNKTKRNEYLHGIESMNWIGCIIHSTYWPIWFN